jgi:hypothetical protein
MRAVDLYRMLSDSAITIEVLSFEQPRYYTGSGWWKRRLDVQTEFLKHVDYRLERSTSSICVRQQN